MVMQSRRTYFDLLVCLSLVNLLLLRVWAQLLPAVVHRANLYVIQQAPHWIHYPAVLLTLFGVAGVACALAAWARRSRRSWPLPLARGALLVLVLLVLNSICAQLPSEFQEGFARAVGPSGAVAIAVVCLALCGWLLRARPGVVFGAVEVFAILGTPFLLMTVVQALWTWVSYDPDSFAGGSFVAGEPAAKLPARREGAPRMVWMVFDELDQRAAFSARPETLDLPELDRLRRESFFSTSAFSPGEGTRRAIASMLLGKQVSWAQPAGSVELPCAIDGAPESDAVPDCWVAYRNLFEELREAGVNAGISGWYHPYCRIFHAAVTKCTAVGLPYWDSPDLFDSFDQQWEDFVKPIPVARLWLRPGARIRKSHRDAYEAILETALQIAGDPSIGFALLHFPIPHHPDIYDPDHGELSIEDERSYLDNLALTDRTLGDVRAVMEAAGLWDASIVVVTSDHWWRAIHRGDWGLLPEEEVVFAGGLDRRIPFLVKFADQHEPLVYPKPFNTVLFHDLVLEIFEERISMASEFRAWLDANRSRAPIPYLPVNRRRASLPSAQLPPGSASRTTIRRSGLSPRRTATASRWRGVGRSDANCQELATSSPGAANSIRTGSPVSEKENSRKGRVSPRPRALT
jgi:hypothetical protein